MNWTEHDLYLFNQGTYYDSFDRMGAHPGVLDGQEGVWFAVWVPGVRSVTVAGSFNDWNDSQFYLEPLYSSGIWTGFVPGVQVGDYYKYKITTHSGESFYKADPYAFHAEKRPGTASRVADLSGYQWQDSDWIAKRDATPHFTTPLNIYEMHLGSWKCPFTPDENTNKEQVDFLYSYREFADLLIPYIKEMGYTHIELMPLSEHPYDGSWGYQVTGYYAPSSRYGDPQDLMYFIDKCHEAGIGVIMDWVPGHFCRDAHGLGRFNGSMLYELFDHKQWGTYIFDFGRPEVRSFLLSNAIFWLMKYHIDGLRVDGVTSMLYLNFAIEDPREKRYNRYGGGENLEAVQFLRDFSALVGQRYPGVFTAAEESTAWPMVTYPPEQGGLGFHYKWDMGWMNDTLKYFSTDFWQRGGSHSLLTFSMMYAFSENFILALSHDEVVHGKKSLIGRMPGDYEQKFAGLRLLYLYQMAHPGAKLNFMGNEFGQFIEWRFYEPLEWFLLEYEPHQKHQQFIKALNHYYLDTPALWADNYTWDGYQWIDADNHSQSILSFLRVDTKTGDYRICVLNMRPWDYGEYDIGVPEEGDYLVDFSTDSMEYGGWGRMTGKPMTAKAQPLHGRDYRITLRLPALSGVLIKPAVPGGLKRKGEEPVLAEETVPAEKSAAKPKAKAKPRTKAKAKAASPIRKKETGEE